MSSPNLEELQEWSEVNEDILISSHEDSRTEVMQAKMTELHTWKEHKVYDEVSDLSQDYVSTRWVITKKLKEGELMYKARLVGLLVMVPRLLKLS